MENFNASEAADRHSSWLSLPKFDLEPMTFKYMSRKREINSYFSEMNDVVEFMKAYPDVSYRYFLQPAKTLLPEYKILEFDFVHTKPVFLQGIADAKAVIDLGPGKSFDNLLAKF